MNINKKLMPQKICYIIFSQTNQSVGGHFRSLSTHYRYFIKSEIINKESFIINFGRVKSPVFTDLNNVFFFKTNLFFIIKIIRLIKSKKPDIIHCYDRASLCLVLIISILYDYKILYTKCGGKNSGHYIDIPTVFFSLENIKDYKNKGYASPSFLLPNRVMRPEVVSNNQLLREKLNINNDSINFLRINRISPAYEKIMDQSVELIRRLQGASINAKLFIVGRIEDDKIFKKYLNINKNVMVVSDPEITHTASHLIPLFDMVIATGRGAMEAYSYGKPILCSTQNSSIPLLVDEHNFETMFYYNFSPRASLANVNEEEELKKIKATISERVGNEAFSFKMFDKFFNIETVASEYLNLYHDIKSEKVNKNLSRMKISHVYYLISKIIKTWI